MTSYSPKISVKYVCSSHAVRTLLSHIRRHTTAEYASQGRSPNPLYLDWFWPLDFFRYRHTAAAVPQNAPGNLCASQAVSIVIEAPAIAASWPPRKTNEWADRTAHWLDRYLRSMGSNWQIAAHYDEGRPHVHALFVAPTHEQAARLPRFGRRDLKDLFASYLRDMGHAGPDGPRGE